MSDEHVAGFAITIVFNLMFIFQNTIDSLKHEVAESRARLHAHSEIERTLRAQLEAARSEIDKSQDESTDNSYVTPYDKSWNMCDAACDPICCEAEDCELRLSANEELSTDANELAAEVRIGLNVYC